MQKAQDKLKELRLDKIIANPDQPRKEFNEEALEELAQSIRTYGVMEPIVVTPRGSMYMIIAGERRYRASLLAGLETIPARIMEANDDLVEEMALLENIQRQDLTPIEEARAFQSLLDRGMSREELANKMGFKQLWRIDERTSLLNLAPEFQDMLQKGQIGNSQAFEMSRLPHGSQGVVFKKIQDGELPTYNRLRAFVDGLIASAKQEIIFELQTLSPEESASVRRLESVVRAVEVFIGEARESVLKKAVFHSDVSVERIDLVIKGLQKVRKAVLSGAGAKDAIEAV